MISLSQIDSTRFEGDELRNICISDVLLSNAKEMTSIESGKVTQSEGSGDKLMIHSDENMLVVAEFLDMQSIRIKALSNPGCRKLQLGDEATHSAEDSCTHTT